MNFEASQTGELNYILYIYILVPSVLNFKLLEIIFWIFARIYEQSKLWIVYSLIVQNPVEIIFLDFGKCDVFCSQHQQTQLTRCCAPLSKLLRILRALVDMEHAVAYCAWHFVFLLWSESKATQKPNMNHWKGMIVKWLIFGYHSTCRCPVLVWNCMKVPDFNNFTRRMFGL